MSLEKEIKNILEGREKVQAVPRPDNKDRKEIQNVGRPDSAEPTSDKSTYTRTAEIYRKVIEDKETTMERLSTQKLFEKVLDIIEEKKGKTKIDLNPKTNPSVSDGEDYDKTKKPMKESNSDPNVDTVNRVADALKKMTKEPKLPHVNDPGVPNQFKIKEGLKGNQPKIAKIAEPKNKITAADFKKLRGEEVEQIDEITPALANRYINKANIDIDNRPEYDEKDSKKNNNRERGIRLATMKKNASAYKISPVKVPTKEDVDFSEKEVDHIASVLEASGVDAQERQSNRDMTKNLNKAIRDKQKEKSQVDRAKDAQRKKEDLLKQQQNQSYEHESDAMIEAVKNSIQNLMKNPDTPFTGVERGVKAKDAGLTHITDGKKK